jgi:hypothetical protein
MPVRPCTKTRSAIRLHEQTVSRVVTGISLDQAMGFSLACLAYNGQETITSFSNG